MAIASKINPRTAVGILCNLPGKVYLETGIVIVSVARQDGSSKRWSVIVDIERREPRPASKTIRTRDVFQTKDDAEKEGLIKGREWIEKHS